MGYSRNSRRGYIPPLEVGYKWDTSGMYPRRKWDSANMKGIRNSRSGTEVGLPIVGRVIASRRSRTKDQVAGNNDR